jgi:hypothetical protein
MIPLAILLHAAFLLGLPFAISTAVGLAALPLLPLLADPPAGARVRNGIIAATALLAVGGAAAALVVPGYSELRPQPLNIAWAEDAELGAAAWLAQTPGGEPALPPELRRAAPFGEPPAWLPPMLAGPAAPAAPLGLPPPRVAVITGTDETNRPCSGSRRPRLAAES